MSMKPKFLLYLALALTCGLCGCKTPGICAGAGNEQSGAAVDGLQMSLCVPKNTDSENPEFKVAIRNTGTNDVCLNLGNMLGLGKVMMPGNIHLVVVDAQGQSRELDYFDRRYAGIAGGMDDYVVPLRAGSTYTLDVWMDQFVSPVTGELLKLETGRYEVFTRFEGRGSGRTNLGMEGMKWMNFWKGKIESNTVIWNPK
jgi:hypothetical protein